MKVEVQGRKCLSLVPIMLGVLVGAVHYQTPEKLRSPAINRTFSQATRFPAATNPVTRIIQPDLAVPTSARYENLPLHFEANRGQIDGQVKFLSRGIGYSLFLTSTEMVMVLREPMRKTTGTRQQAISNSEKRAGLCNPKSKTCTARSRNIENQESTVLRMRFVGANPIPKITGLDELPAKSNYFIGNDPAKWHTNVPHYARVKYEEVYPGIDMVFYGNQRQLEYDFVVAPGADPGRINIAFTGADKIGTDSDGHLVFHTAIGEIQLRKPLVYQKVNGVKEEIAGLYVLNLKSKTQNRKFASVGFQLAAYDRSKPLVIDPVMEFSTYLGGNRDDRGRGVAVDAMGNIYVAGSTSSSDFPTESALDPSYNGGGSNKTDVFVAKIDSAGKALVYSTYLGGTGDDFSAGIGVDTEGNAYVAGDTASEDFPTTVGAYQINRRGDEDVFIAKIDPTGSTLLYSTYLGGSCRNSNSFTDSAGGIAIDGIGNAYVTGSTECRDFPTTTGVVQVNYGGGFGDAFVAEINTAGSSLVYSTFLGGSDDESGNGIAVDQQGNAYVAGYTASGNYPTTVGAFQTKRPGEGDAFVTKVSPDGSHFVYSTYLGGSGGGFIAFDSADAIAVDSSGVAYVTGTTSAGNFPVLNAIQPKRRGDWDAFVSAISSDGSALVYSTYLGGSGGSGGSEEGSAIAVDSLGNAYVTGQTPSSDFPTTADALQSTRGGSNDAFITELASGGALLYSSYLGGSRNDSGNGIVVDGRGRVSVTGWTESDDFPLSNSLQPTKGNAADVFVVKISVQSAPAQPAVSITDVSTSEGDFGTVDAVFNVSLSFAGTLTVNVTFSTADDSAIAGGDYIATSGSLTFNPGEVTKTITVQVKGDTVDEPDEAFFVNLTSATNASIADDLGVGTILNDDGPKIIALDCAAASVQETLSRASPGSTISVTGTCDENILVRNDRVRVFLDGGGTAVINALDSTQPALDVRGKAVAIQGFTITGGSSGIEVERGANAVINSNIIQNNNGNGVVVNQLAFAVLTNNIIQNNTRDGMVVMEGSAARIGFNSESEASPSANTIQNNGGNGIRVSGSSSARLVGNIISNNGGDGVTVSGSSHADISSNNIDNNGGDGIFVGQNGVVNLGEDTGTSIFELPNATNGNNGGFGVGCVEGGVANGRLGTVTGNLGLTSFPVSNGCITDLM